MNEPHHHETVEIHIGDVTARVRPGNHAVAEIKALGHVPLADCLETLIDGQLVELPDDGSVEIRHEMKFFACPRVGCSA